MTKPEEFETVLGEVAKRLGLEPAQVLSHDRRTPLPLARHTLAWSLHGLGWSSLEVAKATGRDHTTVLHGLRVARRQLRTNPMFLDALCDIVPRLMAALGPRAELDAMAETLVAARRGAEINAAYLASVQQAGKEAGGVFRRSVIDALRCVDPSKQRFATVRAQGATGHSWSVLAESVWDGKRFEWVVRERFRDFSAPQSRGVNEDQTSD